MTTKPTRYALFAWGRKEESLTRRITSFEQLFAHDLASEKWKEAHEDRKPKETLLFVAFVSSPDEVIAEVRKDPLRRYVLMTGTVESIEVAMPVFVGGRNLATLDKEWANRPLTQS